MITIGVIGHGQDQETIIQLIDQLYRNFTDPILKKQLKITDVTEEKIFSHSVLKTIDVLLYTSGEYIHLPSSRGKAFPISNFQGILVVNMDDPNVFTFLQNYQSTVVTYGINPRASVTASSIQQDRKGEILIQCCIQRKLLTGKGVIIEPQEFPIVVRGLKKENVHTILGAVTTTLLMSNDNNFYEKIPFSPIEMNPSTFHSKTILNE